MRLIYFILFFFLFSPKLILSSEHTAESERLNPARRVEILKVNDFLYMMKDDGLCFIMERIDSEAPNSSELINSWLEFIIEDESFNKLYFRKNRELLSKTQTHIRQNPNKFSSHNIFLNSSRSFEIDSSSFLSGYHSLRQNLDRFSKSNQQWIAYISAGSLENIEHQGTLKDKIEMTLGVLTDDEAVHTTHIGIQRSFKYLYSSLFGAIEERSHFVIHKNISMKLHAFAASVIRLKDPRKIYMITAPMDKMTEIMIKNLGFERIQSGDSFDFANHEFLLKRGHRSGNQVSIINSISESIDVKSYTSPLRRVGWNFTQIYNKEKTEVLREYRKDFANVSWVFHPHLYLNQTISVDLEALADYL